MLEAGGLAGYLRRSDNARMELLKVILREVVGPVGGILIGALSMAAWLVVLATWCLLVLLFTGRLPWMVRKYL